ncbi:MAG: hypothetical protein ACOX6W_05890 [Lentisphaeria bacterium]
MESGRGRTWTGVDSEAKAGILKIHQGASWRHDWEWTWTDVDRSGQRGEGRHLEDSPRRILAP